MEQNIIRLNRIAGVLEASLESFKRLEANENERDTSDFSVGYIKGNVSSLETSLRLVNEELEILKADRWKHTI